MNTLPTTARNRTRRDGKNDRDVTLRGRTQSVYYRDSQGGEPVNRWLESLLATKPAAVAKIDEFVEEHLNGRRADGPPPEFPITSQIDGGLRELRVRFANTRYRVLYQRSGNLVVLLHALEKKTGAIDAADTHRATTVRRLQDKDGRFAARATSRGRSRRTIAARTRAVIACNLDGTYRL